MAGSLLRATRGVGSHLRQLGSASTVTTRGWMTARPPGTARLIAAAAMVAAAANSSELLQNVLSGVLAPHWERTPSAEGKSFCLGWDFCFILTERRFQTRRSQRPPCPKKHMHIFGKGRQAALAKKEGVVNCPPARPLACAPLPQARLRCWRRRFHRPAWPLTTWPSAALACPLLASMRWQSQWRSWATLRGASCRRAAQRRLEGNLEQRINAFFIFFLEWRPCLCPPRLKALPLPPAPGRPRALAQFPAKRLRARWFSPPVRQGIRCPAASTRLPLPPSLPPCPLRLALPCPISAAGA